MKLLLILLFSFLSFSAKSQKLDHIYKTDSTHIIDGRTYVLKAKKAQVTTFVFKIDDKKNSILTMGTGKLSKDLQVVDKYYNMEPQDDGSYISVYMIEDVKTKETYGLILVFDYNKALAGIGLGDGADTLVFQIKE